MRSTRFLTLTVLSAAALLGPVQAADVGVSISVSQPGVYGRIDIGRFPQPQVVMPQPVIIQPPPPPRGVVGAPPPAVAQPVYLWVPPGHRKDWKKHCRAYKACGVPVYFVDDGWYDRHVHPKKGKKDKGHGDDHPGKGHGKGRDKDKD